MLKQTAAVTAMMLKSLPARWGASLVVVLSIAGVVGVLVAVLAMAQGAEKTMRQNGRADRVVVLRSGQNTEAASRMTRDQVETVLATPGLARDAAGKPLATAEVVTVAGVTKKSTGHSTNITLRGVGENVSQVRPEIKLVQGRWFTPGLRELTVGRRAQSLFAELKLGGQVRLSDTVWTVAGVFEDGGGVHESELWGDAQSVQSASKQITYNSVTGVLQSESAWAAYKDAISSNPTLAHTAWREPEFMQAQGSFGGALLKTIGQLVSAIMALGALFAAVNTLYAAVSARTVEIATLRAIGFSSAPVLMSVMLEGLLLCLAGGVVGGALAYLIFNGTIASGGGQGFSQFVFAFSVGPDLLLQGLVWACVIGLLGGLFPALRAARLPVVEGLRAA